jgi:hypothetical protein
MRPEAFTVSMPSRSDRSTIPVGGLGCSSLFGRFATVVCRGHGIRCQFSPTRVRSFVEVQVEGRRTRKGANSQEICAYSSPRRVMSLGMACIGIGSQAGRCRAS